VAVDDGTRISGRTVLIATGARYRKLDVPRLDEFEGTSVHYAATVLEAQRCHASPVAVVGGGNSAGQASLFLADHAPSVHLLVRHDDLGRDMSRYLVDQIEREPRVTVWLGMEVRQLEGEAGVLDAIVAEEVETGEPRRLDVRALFVFVGVAPQAQWLSAELALDGHGFVVTGPDAVGEDRDGHWRDVGRQPYVLETSRPGVFAAGDVRSGSVKRMGSAVGEGAMAVRLAHRFLQELVGAAAG
jgi:thioredoxin reductase (NADPH)